MSSSKQAAPVVVALIMVSFLILLQIGVIRILVADYLLSTASLISSQMQLNVEVYNNSHHLSGFNFQPQAKPGHH